MSKYFTLAVWTSTMIYNAKNIVKELFTDNDIPLLFTWYNDKCTEYSREKFIARYPGFLSEIDKNGSVEENKELSLNSPSNRLDLEGISDPVVLSSQILSSFDSSSSLSISSSSSCQNESNRLKSQVEKGKSELSLSSSTTCENPDPRNFNIDEYITNIERIILKENRLKFVKTNPLRTVLVKPLTSVWKSFPDYSELNTVISSLNLSSNDFFVFIVVYVCI